MTVNKSLFLSVVSHLFLVASLFFVFPESPLVIAGELLTAHTGCVPTQPPLNKAITCNPPMNSFPVIAGSFATPQQPSVCFPPKVKPTISKGGHQNAHLSPIEIRAEGPIKPLVAYTVGLAGAIVAAPFRLLETVCPIGTGYDFPTGSQIRQQPVASCFPGGPNFPMLPYPGFPPLGKIGNNCPHQAKPRPGQPCGSQGQLWSSQSANRSPSSAENIFPQVEPQSLVGGIVRFPSTMLTQGRIVGDLGAQSPGLR